MTIVKVTRCSMTEPWQEVWVESQSNVGVTYKVVIPDPEIGDAICECPGFVHRGNCYHQEIARGLLCHWDEEISPEEQTEENVCPRCGAETVTTTEVI